jgi:chromatin remodeling complex protein RSC6
MAPIKKNTKASASASASPAADAADAAPAPVVDVPVAADADSPVVESPATATATDVDVDASSSSPAPEATVNAATDLAARLNALQERLANAVKEFQAIAKDIQASLKVAAKDAQKLQKRRGGNHAAAAAAAAASGVPRKLSGFAKPTQLSPELCEFLGVAPETQLARIEVNRLLIKYIKDNNLRGTEDKRVLKPDDKVMKLLNVDDKTNLNYFNVQTYLKPHFIKAVPEAAVAAVAAVAVPVA